MEVVARMRGLKQLRIVGCTQLTDKALARLAVLPRLTHLDIGCNIHFSDGGIASLAAVTSALTPVSTRPFSGGSNGRQPGQAACKPVPPFFYTCWGAACLQACSMSA